MVELNAVPALMQRAFASAPIVPARVARAAVEYRPSYLQTLSADDARRAERLIDGVLEQHPPELIVYRSASDVLDLLEGRISRLHTAGRTPDARGAEYLAERSAAEGKLGIEGATYGAIRLRGLNDRQPLELYGSVGLVMDDAALARTTLTPRDSFGVARTDVAPAKHVRSVLLDAIAPSIPSALRGSDEIATKRLRMALGTHEYVEGQVLDGGVAAADARAVVAFPSSYRAFVDGTAELADRLRAGARTHGLSYEIRDLT